MREKFKQFYNQYNGKFVEVSDSSNLNQCVDLILAWTDTLGIPRIHHLFAYQYFSNPDDLTIQYFEFIPNTPKGIPQCGDIVVFDKNPVSFAGHICIASGNNSDNNKFESFDQNWGSDKHCRLVTHSYDGVLGWLRFRVQQSEPIPSPDLSTYQPQAKINLDSFGIKEAQAIVSSMIDSEKRILDFTKSLQECQNKPPVVEIHEVPKIIYKDDSQLAKIPAVIRWLFGVK